MESRIQKYLNEDENRIEDETLLTRAEKRAKRSAKKRSAEERKKANASQQAITNGSQAPIAIADTDEGRVIAPVTAQRSDNDPSSSASQKPSVAEREGARLTQIGSQ